MSDFDTLRMELEIEKERSKRKDAERRLRDAAATVGELESKLAFIESMPPAPKTEFKADARIKAGARGSVVAAWTDWHCEEKVDPGTVDGMNAYDPAECEKRVKRLVDKTCMMIDHQRRLTKIDEIVVAILGDIITGYIHEELVENNYMSPTEAVVFALELIYKGLTAIQKQSRLPMRVPVCIGNHGRTTQRRRVSTGYKNSYEWLMYVMLAKHLAGKRIPVLIGKGYHNVVTVQGRDIRFHHGDAIRYQGGVGGITIPVNKAVAQWNKSRHCYLDLFGHWHQHLVHGKSWVAGNSLIGHNAYAVEIKAEYQEPSQPFLVIDRDYGLTQAMELFVTQPRQKP